MSSSHLIFGCGYLGQRVARLWQAHGEGVTVVTRSAGRAAAFRDEGYAAVIADVTQPATLGALPPVDSMLFAVGFDRAAGGDIHSVYARGVENVLAALPARVARCTYVSTTGVYGPARGAWVDEATPPAPVRDGGRASLAAEQALAAHALGKRGAILRLAGIYGPGRVPNAAPLLAGEPIAAPSAGWLNLIHVDDAAAVVVSADRWLSARPAADGPHIFCVSDGSPVARGAYYAEAARLLGAPPPRFEAPSTDSPAAARAAADRRVRNDKMSATFQVPLRYPTYRDGLAGALVAES